MEICHFRDVAARESFRRCFSGEIARLTPTDPPHPKVSGLYVYEYQTI